MPRTRHREEAAQAPPSIQTCSALTRGGSRSGAGQKSAPGAGRRCAQTWGNLREWVGGGREGARGSLANSQWTSQLLLASSAPLHNGFPRLHCYLLALPNCFPRLHYYLRRLLPWTLCSVLAACSAPHSVVACSWHVRCELLCGLLILTCVLAATFDGRSARSVLRVGVLRCCAALLLSLFVSFCLRACGAFFR
jgi:hypothetical protein